MRAPLGPGQPPYEGPYDIPVIVDDRPKRLDAFQMTRCTFFTIEATEAVDDWVAQLRVNDVPFLLLGVFAVIHRPDLEAARFSSPQQISSLFDKIEDTAGLVLRHASSCKAERSRQGTRRCQDGLHPSGHRLPARRPSGGRHPRQRY